LTLRRFGAHHARTAPGSQRAEGGAQREIPPVEHDPGLALGVTGTVALAFAAGAYLYSQRHYQTLLDTARATALAQGHLILAASSTR